MGHPEQPAETPEGAPSSAQLGISESLSKKRKRGRPRLLSTRDELNLDRLFPGRSRRTLQNRRYAAHAMEALGGGDAPDPGRYAWIWNGTKGVGPAGKGTKWTILAELGRLRGPDVIRSAARLVCDERLTTAQATGLVRQVRLGNVERAQELLNRSRRQASRQASPRRKLAGALFAAIEDHRRRHPGTTQDDAFAALTPVIDFVRDDEAWAKAGR